MFLYRKKNRVNQGNLSFNNEVTLGKVRQWSKERNSCFADLYLFEFLRCNELLFQNTVPILAAVKNGKLFSTFCKNSSTFCSVSSLILEIRAVSKFSITPKKNAMITSYIYSPVTLMTRNVLAFTTCYKRYFNVIKLYAFIAIQIEFISSHMARNAGATALLFWDV